MQNLHNNVVREIHVTASQLLTVPCGVLLLLLLLLLLLKSVLLAVPSISFTTPWETFSFWYSLPPQPPPQQLVKKLFIFDNFALCVLLKVACCQDSCVLRKGVCGNRRSAVFRLFRVYLAISVFKKTGNLFRHLSNYI